MRVFEPNTPNPALRERLQQTHIDLVVCFCAAWCNACQDYRLKFEHLATQLPQYTFVWIDIEDHPELLGEEDIENFPTLLIQRADHNVFYGPLQPHISHLTRLLASLHAESPYVPTRLPNIRQHLMARI